MSERPSVALFTPAVATSFTVTTDSGEISLRLLSVTPRDQYVPDAPSGWVPFTLLFAGPAEHPLDQRTYRMTNDAIGALDIFVVPIGRTAAEFHYEAVFG